MLVRIHPDNPAERQLNMVIDCLSRDGVIIYPTDTVYALGCSIHSPRALERVARMRGMKLEKANFSFVCHDLSNISAYTKPIPNNVYKMMKKAFPGPFTFILDANSNVPKIFQHKKKTIGIRVPDNNIIREIVRMLGNPVVSTSIHDEDEIVEYTTDPELIYEKYSNLVDMVVDGGYGDNEASTVVDCTADEPVVVRQGKGDFDTLYY